MQGDHSKGADTLLLVAGYGVCLIMAVLCVMLLVKIWRNEIDLSRLISESNGNASMSRFQLLIFTMMVAISLFILVVKNWQFPVIPDGVLTLLGISASTYAVGKGIQFSQPQTLVDPKERKKVLDQVQEMSNTGADVEVKPGFIRTKGTPEGERETASSQDNKKPADDDDQDGK